MLKLLLCVFTYTLLDLSRTEIIDINKSGQNKTNTTISKELIKPDETSNYGLNLTQSKKTERNADAVFSNFSSISGQTFNTNGTTIENGFRPSPPLDGVFEFNRIPVQPGESQHRQNNFHNLPETTHTITNNWGNPQPWTVSKIKFPDTLSTIPSPKIQHNVTPDHPYEFEGASKSKNDNKKESPPSRFDSDSDHKQGSRNQYWEKNGYESRRPLYHDFDFTQPVQNGFKTEEYGVSSVYTGKQYNELQYKTEAGSHWKKIIKFLAAFIPIGLLISALTPTVITVTPMNGTIRSRAEDHSNPNTNRLASSLNYFKNVQGCEDRILCELLLSASTTKDSVQHAQNLLDSYTENGKTEEKIEIMNKIFQAVKDRDCSSISCRKIRKK